MAAREHRRRIALVGCALLALWSWSGEACAAASPPYAGQPLAQVLEALRAQGLDLLYSSQLVHPGLRVLEEPAGSTAQAVLSEILAPHGLEARPIGANRFVIVRSGQPPATRALTPPVTDDSRTLDEVLVHASRYALGHESHASLTAFDRQQLDALPGVEQDAIRALQRIPGSAASGLSALTHVRGSYEDEVLIRFDGVRLYEPFHFKDFLNLIGVIDPELVDTVDAYSGGFPVEFGDRAGGVLDIAPRQTDGMENLIGVSVINNRVISSGSHARERGHWLVGYRRSNLVPVLRQADVDIGEPQFEDYFARYSYQLTPAFKAAVGFLGLQDDHEVFNQERTQLANARYGDDAAWLQLDYSATERWEVGMHVSHSHLSAQRSGTAERAGVSEGSLNESRISTIDEVRFEGSFRPSARLHWRAGVEFARSDAFYDYTADATFESPLAEAFGRAPILARDLSVRTDGHSYNAWTAARAEVGAATMELGVRYDERSWLDSGAQFSPRLSVRYDLDPATVLRFSAGRFLQSQSLNELELEELTPAFAVPETARHLILGFEHEFDPSLGVRIEAFDRQTRGVRPRFESLLNPLVLLPELEVDRVRVAPHSSRSRGVELTVRNDPAADLNWWATYSWSRSDDRFDDGGETARSWDQRNSFSAGAVWRHAPWLMSATAGYISGWPFTSLEFSGPPNGDASGFTSALLGPRNRERFEDRLFLDLRAEYSFALPRGALEVVLEVRNALLEGNDCCRDVEVAPLAGGAFTSEIRNRTWVGLVPILGINWRF